MQIFNHPSKISRQILALGPESNGNFSVFKNGRIYFSEDFGDLLLDINLSRFKKELNAFLKKEQLTPDVILTDLHPIYKTTVLGKDLAKKYKAQHIQIQHHLAHIFSQISNSQIQNYFYGIALDGTGYGIDGKIWGGECFAISNFKFQISNEFSNPNDKISKQKLKIERIGHLENQTMLGGDLAIQEPARMLLSILSKFLSKEEIYVQIKKYYSRQEFEVLHNQLQQNFNCIETSSTGRILDAVSLLLGFCDNERNYKHEAINLLESNSSKPYSDIKPKIDIIDSNLISNFKFQISNEIPMTKCQNKYHILNTTFLFEYLIKNIDKDKKRLAATAQIYIAEGLHEIICHSGLEPESSHKTLILDSRFYHKGTSFGRTGNDIVLSGGITNNKIISEYFEHKKAGSSSRMPAVQIPRGDAGLSFGQINYYLNNQ